MLRFVVAMLALVSLPWQPAAAQFLREVWLDCKVTEASVVETPDGPQPETSSPVDWVLRFDPATDTVRVALGPANGGPIVFVQQEVGLLDPYGGGSYFKTSVNDSRITLTWDKIASRGQSHRVYTIDRGNLSISIAMNANGVGWTSRGRGTGTCAAIPPQPVAGRSP